MTNVSAVGAIAVSKSGRDAGRIFIIVGVLDDGTVSVCDGRLRKIVKPKKKNLRHLSVIDACRKDVCRLIADGGLTDAMAREILAKYRIDPEKSAKE